MTAPLKLSFDVACSVEHAFDVRTNRIDTWWPSGHSVSADRGWHQLSDGQQWRERNVIGWHSLVPHFIDAIEKET